jgi:hypothetical protein
VAGGGTALAAVLEAGKSQRLVVVSAGVRVFERLGDKICQDPELKVPPNPVSHSTPSPWIHTTPHSRQLGVNWAVLAVGLRILE